MAGERLLVRGRAGVYERRLRCTAVWALSRHRRAHAAAHSLSHMVDTALLAQPGGSEPLKRL
jgi:hypothetical protein